MFAVKISPGGFVHLAIITTPCLFINLTAVGWAGHVLPSVYFFFSFVGEQTQTHTRPIVVTG